MGEDDWRRGWDSNPRKDLTSLNGLANRRLQPLGHPSAGAQLGGIPHTAFAALLLGPPCGGYPQLRPGGGVAERLKAAVC